METKVNIKDLSKEERAKLLAELQNEEKQNRIERRETYEGLRAEMMHEVEQRLIEPSRGGDRQLQVAGVRHQHQPGRQGQPILPGRRGAAPGKERQGEGRQQASRLHGLRDS